ncbi:MAG TPA: hypothetical protein DCM54_02805 [Gammaproteobacteria bacterium]|nr:hypothetical protein [Gammaproteobacteria bacterium]
MLATPRNIVVYSILALCLLVAAPTSIAGPNVSAQSDFDNLNLAPLIEYHVDSSNKNHQRITSLPDDVWVHSEVSNLAFGFTSATIWFRFQVTNQSSANEELLLQMAYARFDSIGVYLHRDGDFSVLRSGSDHAFDKRAIAHRNHLFPIDLDQGESASVFIRARTSGAFNFPLSLWNKEPFYENDQNLQLLHGAYFGVWLLVVIFNVVLYSAIRHKALAGFLGIIFSIGMYQITTLGIGITQIWDRYPDLYDIMIVLSLSLAILSLGWLCEHLLNLKEDNPIRSRVLHAVTYPAILGIIAYPIFATGVFPFLLALTIPASCVVMTLSIRSAIQGNRLGLYSSIAFSTLLIGLVLRALNRFEVIPNNFLTEHALPTGFIEMIVTLSFSIAAEYRRQSKLQQKEILLAQESLEPGQASSDLEHMVSERTVELEDTLAEPSQVNETLREINTMDAVTGIKNRHYFEEVFRGGGGGASREQYPVSVLLMDIDHFKKVNDNYGHLAGDECLRAVANTISTTIKRPADILARYGGEEFVAVLPYIENDNAMSFANQIRERIEASTYIADGHEINVTMSIGVCTVTPTETDEQKMSSLRQILLFTKQRTRVETKYVTRGSL